MRTAIALTLLVPALAGIAVTGATITPTTPVAATPRPVTSGTPAARTTVDRAGSALTPSRAGPGSAPGQASPSTERPSRRWGWPLQPRPTVVRHFDRPEHRWSAGHRGADLLSAVGQPVLAAGDGVVAFVGTVAGRGVVSIRHAGGWRTTYEPVDATVAVGAAVHRGDRIGTLTRTAGHCAPRSCLHWGALFGDDYRDPLALVLVRRPVLLPLS